MLLEIYRFAFDPATSKISTPVVSPSFRSRSSIFPPQPSRATKDACVPSSSRRRPTGPRVAVVGTPVTRVVSIDRSRDPVEVVVVVVAASPRSFERAPQSEAEISGRARRPVDVSII
jgi:hypothetical protein